MEIHVCSLKNAEEKTDGECFAGNRTTHQGNVKKRGQGNTAYKQRFFVLRDDALYYYTNEKDYLDKVESGCKGAIPMKSIKVKRGTPKGAYNSSYITN